MNDLCNKIQLNKEKIDQTDLLVKLEMEKVNSIDESIVYLEENKNESLEHIDKYAFKT